MSCCGTRIINTGAGSMGGGPYNVVNVSGIYTVTDTSSTNSFMIDVNDVIPPTSVGDADNDTSISTVEGGGSGGGDSIDFQVDNTNVGSVEISGGFIKWTLNGIVDPIAFAAAPVNTATRNTLPASAGYLAYNSDVSGFQYHDGSAWQNFGAGGSSTFVSLTDTPGSLGTPGQAVVVNASGTALDFITVSAADARVTDVQLSGQILDFTATNNAFSGQVDLSTVGTNIVNNSITSTVTGTKTQSFNDTGQNWNNLGTFTVNQEIAAFPGNYFSTDWTLNNFDITANGGAGVQGIYNFRPGSFLLDVSAGTDDVGIDAQSGGLRLFKTTTAPLGQDVEIQLNNNYINLEFATTAELRINNDAGTPGSVLTSAGPSGNPTWTTLPSGTTDTTLVNNSIVAINGNQTQDFAGTSQTWNALGDLSLNFSGGGLLVNGDAGTAGYVLTSSGTGEAPYWSPAAAGNIYTQDDTLTGNRSVDLSGFTLDFTQTVGDEVASIGWDAGGEITMFAQNNSGITSNSFFTVRDQGFGAYAEMKSIGPSGQLEVSTYQSKTGDGRLIIKTPNVRDGVATVNQVLALSNSGTGEVEFVDAAQNKAVTDKKAAGSATLSVSDLGRFIVVEPSGASNLVTLPNVGAAEQNCIVELYNNGSDNAFLVASGGDTLIGSVILEPGNGALLKVTDTDEITAIGTGASIKKYSATFTQASWTAQPSGIWTLEVSGTTHGVGTDYQVQVSEGTGPYVVVGMDSISIAANGDLTLGTTTISGFDGRYNLIG